MCGEKGGFQAERGVVERGYECSERGQGGPRGGQVMNQGLECKVRRVVSGLRGELLGGAVSARSVGKKGQEGDKARIRVWGVR